MARPADFSNIPNAAGGNGADIGAFEMQLTPAAATVSITGRVVTADGRGIRNALVSLTDQSGQTRTAMTGKSGYYGFADLPVGSIYILQIRAKRFSFTNPMQIVSLNEDAEEYNFVAAP